MECELISFTPNPELLMASAARLCYRDISALDIMKDFPKEEQERILDLIISSGHHSVLEHVSFSFALDGVSRVLTHQLIRHRVGIAYSQQSQRYVSVGNAGFVTPNSITTHGLGVRYQKLMETIMAFYKDAQDLGVPNEDARYALPQSIMTRMVVTANARQLIHMYAINACFRSQWEFRNLMNLMRAEVRKGSPRIADEMRIKCYINGYCDEAKMCEQLKGKMPRRNLATLSGPDKRDE